MKALRWTGTGKVGIENVALPQIQHPRDAIVRITLTALSGTDLHLFGGNMPSMEKGSILGHEAVGEVVDVGGQIENLKKGDRVVVPAFLSCGNCFHCKREEFSLCEASNPNVAESRNTVGYAPAGVLGMSRVYGGFPGTHAEFVRVPFADVGLFKIESNLPDEKLIALSEDFPAGYLAAENCQMDYGDTVAVWGCGAVGQFAIISAWLFGASRVIAIDRVPERLAMAAREGKADTINFEEEDVSHRLLELTAGRGPDRCIYAVGTDAHGSSSDSFFEKLTRSSERMHPLRQALNCCRKGGTISIAGLYVSGSDNIPLSTLMNKALTIRTGPTHMTKVFPKLLKLIEDGKVNSSFVITHRAPLEEAPKLYKVFRDKEEGCVKVVLKP